VLLVHGGDVSAPGGLETHVRELARHLAKRGHAVTIQGRPLRYPPFTMTESGDASSFDVIHHHTGAWRTGRGARARADGPRAAPAVRTLHFCTAAKMALYVRRGRLRTLVNPGNWRAAADERAACRSTARLIAVSRRVREECARFYGLDPTRATVISNGASFAPPTLTRETLRRRHGIGPDAPVLLTIGRADFVKGYDLLGKAWERVATAPRRAIWVSVGGRRPKRESDRLVTGPVPHGEALDWIHAADFGALPSLSEGCSVALLEMLAGRLYTLSHDVGNAAEVIRSSANGEIVPQRLDAWVEALGRLVAKPPARPAEGLDPAYGWDSIASQVEAVYRAAVAEAAR
jgi:glycosyltransferase involved in cell wall biosynthesis